MQARHCQVYAGYMPDLGNKDLQSIFQVYSCQGIVGRVGRATAHDALCCGFDTCRQRPRGVAVDFGPKQSGWLINQLDNPSLEQEDDSIKLHLNMHVQEMLDKYKNYIQLALKPKTIPMQLEL